MTLYAPREILELAATDEIDPREFFIVSALKLETPEKAPADAFQGEDLTELKVGVEQAKGRKCERCWRIDEELGTDPAHPDACPRCTAVLRTLG